MRRRLLSVAALALIAVAVSGCAAYVEPAPVVYRPYYYDPYYSCGPSVVVVNRGYYGGYYGYHRWR